MGIPFENIELLVVFKFGLLMMTWGSGLEKYKWFLYFVSALFKAEKYNQKAYQVLVVCGILHGIWYYNY